MKGLTVTEPYHVRTTRDVLAAGRDVTDQLTVAFPDLAAGCRDAVDGDGRAAFALVGVMRSLLAQFLEEHDAE